MFNSLVTVSALAGMAMAQTSSVFDLYLPKYIVEGHDLVASVISAAPTKIEYLVQCPPGQDPNDCGLADGATVTMEPGTYGLYLSKPPDFVSGQPEIESGIITGVSSEDFFMPVTITAGFEILAAATATRTRATADGSSATPAATASPASTLTGAANPASTSAEAASPSTGVAPHMTRDVALAGVAALVACALAL